MKSCPQCAKSYPDSEMFCADDGAGLVSQSGPKARRTELVTPVASEQPSGLDCPVCGGRALSPEEEVCAFCGARLRPTGSAPAAAPAGLSGQSTTTRSAQPPPGEQTFDDEPTTPPPSRGAGRALGVAGYTLAALAALAAGAWFALHLSANHAQQAKLAPEASPSSAVVAEPLVALADNPPLQVTGESASDPARNQDAARKIFEDNKAALLDRYKALEADKPLADGMIATLRVAPSGEVGEGAVATSTNVNPALDSAIIKEMTGWRFAPFGGSSVEVRYPVVFAPDPASEAKAEAQLADKVANLSPTEPLEYTAALAPSPSPEAIPSPATKEVASVPAPPLGVASVPPVPPLAAAVAPEAAAPVVPKKPRRHKIKLASVPPPKPSLLDRVQEALRSRKELAGAKAFTSGDTVTLYGRVFDDGAKSLAERVARNVPGVGSVNDTLTTDTSLWLERQNQIARELQNVGLSKVTVKVIGKDAYLGGEVSSNAQRDQAATIAESAAPVRVRTNLIRVVPKGLLGF